MTWKMWKKVQDNTAGGQGNDKKCVKNSKKTSKDFQRDLALAGENVASSTVRRRLFEVGETARRPLRKQLLTKAIKKKCLSWVHNHARWTKGDWRKVIFSDELHFEVYGHKSAVV